MENKVYLNLGYLHFTKKAMLILSFGFFITGMVLGGFILSSVKSNESFNLIYFWLMNILIWFFTFRSLKNEVVESSPNK